MHGNSFYMITRQKSRRDETPVCWHGDGWSTDMNDAVLFRHAGSAVRFSRSRRWPIRGEHPYDRAMRLSVEITTAEPELRLAEIIFR